MVSNHKVSRLHISMLHRNIVRRLGQNGKLIMIGDGNGMKERKIEENKWVESGIEVSMLK